MEKLKVKDTVEKRRGFRENEYFRGYWRNIVHCINHSHSTHDSIWLTKKNQMGKKTEEKEEVS